MKWELSPIQKENHFTSLRCSLWGFPRNKPKGWFARRRISTIESFTLRMIKEFPSDEIAQLFNKINLESLSLLASSTLYVTQFHAWASHFIRFDERSTPISIICDKRKFSDDGKNGNFTPIKQLSALKFADTFSLSKQFFNSNKFESFLTKSEVN